MVGIIIQHTIIQQLKQSYLCPYFLFLCGVVLKDFSSYVRLYNVLKFNLLQFTILKFKKQLNISCW